MRISLAALESKLPQHIKKYHCPCNGNNLSIAKIEYFLKLYFTDLAKSNS